MESATTTIAPFINNSRRLLFYWLWANEFIHSRPSIPLGFENTNLFFSSLSLYWIYIYTNTTSPSLILSPIVRKIARPETILEESEWTHKSLIKVWQKAKKKKNIIYPNFFSGVTNNPVRHHPRGEVIYYLFYTTTSAGSSKQKRAINPDVVAVVETEQTIASLPS